MCFLSSVVRLTTKKCRPQGSGNSNRPSLTLEQKILRSAPSTELPASELTILYSNLITSKNTLLVELLHSIPIGLCADFRLELSFSSARSSACVLESLIPNSHRNGMQRRSDSPSETVGLWFFDVFPWRDLILVYFRAAVGSSSVCLVPSICWSRFCKSQWFS